MQVAVGEDCATRLKEEVRAHADLLAADYLAQGVSESNAHYSAMRELGNITSLTQEYREQSGLPWLENFWLDLKYALRTLRRNPTFPGACIATLTVGFRRHDHSAGLCLGVALEAPALLSAGVAASVEGDGSDKRSMIFLRAYAAGPGAALQLSKRGGWLPV